MKTIAIPALIATTALLASNPVQAGTEKCMPIGGVAVANFFAEGDGRPVIISAALTGSVNNAAGKIISQIQTATGLEMDMEHYFGRDDGGAIYTKDKAVLTAIPEKPGRYMIEITYHIQNRVSRGTLAGFGGTFQSYGLVDMRDPANMQGLVRYSGSICKQ